MSAERERVFRQERMELKQAVYAKAKARGMNAGDTAALQRRADAILKDKQEKLRRSGR